MGTYFCNSSQDHHHSGPDGYDCFKVNHMVTITILNSFISFIFSDHFVFSRGHGGPGVYPGSTEREAGTHPGWVTSPSQVTSGQVTPRGNLA